MNTEPLPFRFPAEADEWPIRDPDAGIAFPKGGMHGAFHAGVVHAFVMSGYYPQQVAGSSMGVFGAAALAVAGEIEDQARRMEMMDELAEVWLANPGRQIYEHMWDASGPRELIEAGLKIRLPTGQLGRALWQLWRGGTAQRVWAGLRIWWALPWSRRALSARWGVVKAVGRRLMIGRPASALDLSLDAAQAVLDAYGLHDSLFASNPGDEGFYDLFERWMPARADGPTLMEDLSRSSLSFQVANLRWASEAAISDSTAERKATLVIKDGQGASLVGAMRASTSLQPMHPPVRAHTVFPGELPTGLRPSDALVDASYVEYIPVGRVIDRWREQGPAARTRPKRLFTVLTDPVEGAPPTEGEGYLGHAVHDLYLLRQRDLLYDVQVTRLVTELLRASGSPGELDLIVVDPEPIAPEQMLGFMPVSVPREDRLARALASGCRSTLEVLHQDSLEALPAADAGKVPCARLLAHLREITSAPEGYFRPRESVCASCTRSLRVPEPAAPPEPLTPLREVDHLHRLRGGPPEGQPATVIVPAGGAFLGVFQIGALVALRELGVQPDVYAGSSIGTLFSMLLYSGLQPGKPIDPELIRRMFNVPEWVDETEASRESGGPGRVDQLVADVLARLDEPRVQALLRLPPRRLAELFEDGEEPSRPELWNRRKVVSEGVEALFFPGDGAGPGGERALEGWRDLRDMAAHVMTGNLEAVLAFGDKVIEDLGVLVPGKEHDSEFIGFEETERLMRQFVFEDGEPPGLDHFGGNEARFIFTVTNHTTGRLEIFGGPPHAWRAPLQDWQNEEQQWVVDKEVVPEPDALQAALAASSLPLAFRRRSRDEVFQDYAGEADQFYTDGGIFNNFPADSALKYLRYLSRFPDYAWLGTQDVRFVLLPLKFPSPPPKPLMSNEGCLRAVRLTIREGDHSKLRRVLVQQRLVHEVGEATNHRVRELGGLTGARQAILTDFDIIAPARKVYPGSWSFKEWLGFTRGKQEELLAAGCRRSRYSLAWRDWREAREAEGLPAPLEVFDGEVRVQIEAWKDIKRPRCVLGRFNERTCAFLEVDPSSGEAILKTCRATAHKDLPPQDLPPTSRVDIWARMVAREGPTGGS